MNSSKDKLEYENLFKRFESIHFTDSDKEEISTRLQISLNKSKRRKRIANVVHPILSSAFIILLCIISGTFIANEIITNNSTGNKINNNQIHLITEIFDDPIVVTALLGNEEEIISIQYLNSGIYRIETIKNTFLIELKDEHTIAIFEYKETVNKSRNLEQQNQATSDELDTTITVRIVDLHSLDENYSKHVPQIQMDKDYATIDFYDDPSQIVIFNDDEIKYAASNLKGGEEEYSIEELLEIAKLFKINREK